MAHEGKLDVDYASEMPVFLVAFQTWPLKLRNCRFRGPLPWHVSGGKYQ